MKPESDNPAFEKTISQAEDLGQRREFDQARDLLLRAAKEQPDAATRLLQRALQFPGDSSGVWLAMGQAAHKQGQDAQALQHLKTGIWLAMKLKLTDRVQEGMQQIEKLDAEVDAGWHQKTRDWLIEQNSNPAPQTTHICDFCGQDNFATGELFEGIKSTICPGCVHKLHLQLAQTEDP